jgi:hypothetical protein
VRRNEATRNAVAQGRSRPAPPRDTRRHVSRLNMNLTNAGDSPATRDAAAVSRGGVRLSVALCCDATTQARSSRTRRASRSRRRSRDTGDAARTARSANRRIGGRPIGMLVQRHDTDRAGFRRVPPTGFDRRHRAPVTGYLGSRREIARIGNARRPLTLGVSGRPNFRKASRLAATR